MNLGNPEEPSISELARRVVALIGSNSKVSYKPLPADDPLQRRPDIRLAKENLNWEPRVDLEIGLKRTIEYFDSLLDGKSDKPVLVRSM